MKGKELRVFFLVIVVFSSLTILYVRYGSLNMSLHPHPKMAADKTSSFIEPPRTTPPKQDLDFRGVLSRKWKVYGPRVTLPSPIENYVMTHLQLGKLPPKKVKVTPKKVKVTPKKVKVMPKKVKVPLASREMPPMKVDSRLTEFDLVRNFSNVDTAKYISESAMHACEGVLCLNLLTEQDRKAFYVCWENSTKYDKRKVHQASGACHFRYGKGLGHVGLVGFPGSGNTWIRDLLQRATGVCTGSCYCDAALRKGGFDGEGVESSSVVAIKSHERLPSWSTKVGQLERGGVMSRVLFDSVILLIRNPFDAIVSEWNRLLASKYHLYARLGDQHTENHNQTFFMTYPKWKKFIKAYVSKWKEYFNWLVDIPKGHTILLVRYEDFKANVTKEVKRMLEFLHYRATDQQLEQRLLAGVDAFKRSKRTKFQHYTLEDTTLVNKAIHTVEEFLQLKLGDNLGVGEYVKTT